MKKSWGVLSILLLLVIPLVHAEDPPATNEAEFNKTLNDARQVTFRAIQARTDAVTEKQVDLPAGLEPIIKVLLRFEEPFSFSELIIAIGIFALFAITFVDILKTFSLFSEPTSVVIGIILAVIMSIVGAVKSLAIFLIGSGSPLKFIESWNAGALFFWLIIIVLLIYGLNKALKLIHEHKIINEARKDGIKAGAESAFSRWMRKSMEWLD